MKKIILAFTLVIGLHSILVGQSKNHSIFSNDSCFINYLLGVDSTIVLKETKIPKEAFVFFNTLKDTANKVVQFTSFDKKYIICITQNIFDDYVANLSTANILVYSRLTKQIALFIHYSDLSLECRNTINFFEIAPFSRQCFVFNEKYQLVAEVFYQYYLRDGKTYYTFIEEQNGVKLEATKRIIEFDKFVQRMDLFLSYKEFVFFLDTIFSPPKKYATNLKWKKYSGDNLYINFIENSYGSKNVEKFKCRK